MNALCCNGNFNQSSYLNPYLFISMAARRPVRQTGKTYHSRLIFSSSLLRSYRLVLLNGRPCTDRLSFVSLTPESDGCLESNSTQRVLFAICGEGWNKRGNGAEEMEETRWLWRNFHQRGREDQQNPSESKGIGEGERERENPLQKLTTHRIIFLYVTIHSVPLPAQFLMFVHYSH